MEDNPSTDETGEGIQHVQILQSGEMDNQGETITLSLEDAAQFIFQQQGFQGEGSLPPGTYQIITQQLTSNGDPQMVTLTDGVNVIQTNSTAEQLQGIDIGNQHIILQSNIEGDVEADTQLPEGVLLQSYPQCISHAADTQQQTTLPADADVIKNGDSDKENDDQASQDELDNQSESVLQIDLPHSQSEHMLQMINQTADVQKDIGSHEDSSSFQTIETVDNESYIPNTQYTQTLLNLDDVKGIQPVDNTQPASTSDESQVKIDGSFVQQAGVNDDYVHAQSPSDTTSTEPVRVATPVKAGSIKVEKKPDLAKPIEVTDHMEVMVGGKKCLLKVNPDTGQLCAYPILKTGSTGRKRGRPKKSEMIEKYGEDWPVKKPHLDTDQTNSAAEGLLELSNTGPDGVRRSGRSRKKASTLEDYEVLEVSSDDAANVDDLNDEEVLPSGATRKRKIAYHQDYIPTTPVTNSTVKRGRGRPRRYPRPGDPPTTTQIPAMIIPSSDGTTIMMAPIQGLTNLEAFQDQMKTVQLFQQQKTEFTDDASQYFNTTNLLDLGDGTQVNIQLQAPTDGTVLVGGDIKPDKDTMEAFNSIKAETQEVSLRSGTDVDGEPVNTDLLDATISNSGDDSSKLLTSSEETQPTIIQIPENLLPMFMQKKDPIKLGLKASDQQLDKFRCEKCGYQGYYEQQYQSHLETHTEDIIKCKCCQFVALDKEAILEHFKSNHPRCICNVCGHMAEHAYIIKRHLMRHSQDGCKCEMCGKVYKDQYVLKMHIKMVHMPAEVLFECTVCTKKFTRKAHLKRHLRIHDPEKQFKCPHCTYRGCERSDISKHLLIHEEPKHVCEVCGKPFRHIKNKELHLKRHNGQRDYKCGVCDFYGYTFTDIRKHIERKHTDTKSYICDKCGSAFKSDLQLREHKSQQCEVFMIEQALAIATSDGGTSHATIQIPREYNLDSQHIQIDNNGQITIESLTGEAISLTEEQIQAVVSQAQISDTGLQISQAPITDTELQAAMAQGQITDTGQIQVGILGEEGLQGAAEGSGAIHVHYTGGVGDVGIPLTEEEEEEEGEEGDEDSDIDEDQEDLNESGDLGRGEGDLDESDIQEDLCSVGTGDIEETDIHGGLHQSDMHTDIEQSVVEGVLEEKEMTEVDNDINEAVIESDMNGIVSGSEQQLLEMVHIMR